MVDLSTQAAYEEAIAVAGQTVTFQRLVGVAPSVTVTPTGGAAVTAVVRDYLPDSGASSQAGYGAGDVGAVTQGERMILVMAADLVAAGFPAPLQKGDQAVLAATGEILTITRVDAGKRLLAGCIEAYGVGVA